MAAAPADFRARFAELQGGTAGVAIGMCTDWLGLAFVPEIDLCRRSVYCGRSSGIGLDVRIVTMDGRQMDAD